MPIGEILKRLERGDTVAEGVTHAVAGQLEAVFTALGVATSRRSTPVPSPEPAVSNALPGASNGGIPTGFGSRARRVALLASGLGVVLIASLAGAFIGRVGASPAPQLPGRSAAAPASAGALQPKNIARQIMPSVVLLRCGGHLGTGFFVTEDKLLSNAHVTCGDEAIEVELHDGQKGEARVERADEMLDAAVLKLSNLTGKPLALASAGGLAAGDLLMVAGHPEGLDFTFHVGTVSNPNRMILGINYLQVDARINPGNSGGPAIDEQGRVVGIVSLKRPGAEGLGMALPIDSLYEGAYPMLPPPAEHPSAGFRAMLDAAKEATRKLVAEQSELGVRLIGLAPGGNGGFIAMVTSMTTISPRELLPFRLENDAGDRCSIEVTARWQKSAPDDGFAKRSIEFLKREGLGDVYFSPVDLDFENCEIQTPSKLVLEIGDEAKNTIKLE